MKFTVVAVVGGVRGEFTGRQFFDALIDHIGKRRIKVIRAEWTSQAGYDANLKKFNEATRRNAAKGNENQEAAAFETYTGQWADDYGFKVAQNIETKPADIPGGYEQVEVDFVRPPRRKKA